MHEIKRSANACCLALALNLSLSLQSASGHDVTEKINEVTQSDFSGYQISTVFVGNCSDGTNLDNGALCYFRRIINKSEYTEGCLKRVIYESGRGDQLMTGIWRHFNQDGQILNESLYHDEELLFRREFAPGTQKITREISPKVTKNLISNCRPYR